MEATHRIQTMGADVRCALSCFLPDNACKVYYAHAVAPCLDAATSKCFSPCASYLAAFHMEIPDCVQVEASSRRRF